MRGAVENSNVKMTVLTKKKTSKSAITKNEIDDKKQIPSNNKEESKNVEEKSKENTNEINYELIDAISEEYIKNAHRHHRRIQ